MDSSYKATSTPLKPKSQSVEPRRRRLGVRTIPCVFGDKKNQEVLMCVFRVSFVFEKKEKGVETSR